MTEYELTDELGNPVGMLCVGKGALLRILDSSFPPLSLSKPDFSNVNKKTNSEIYQPLTETSISEDNPDDQLYFEKSKRLSPVDMHRFLEENLNVIKGNIMNYELNERNRINYLCNKLSEIMDEILLKETKASLDNKGDIERLYAQGLKIVFLMTGEIIPDNKLGV